MAKLKVSDDGLKSILEKSSERLEKMHSVLDDLHIAIKGAPRSASPARRSGGASVNVSGKWSQ